MRPTGANIRRATDRNLANTRRPGSRLGLTSASVTAATDKGDRAAISRVAVSTASRTA
jgi:hypothetical protein